MPGEGETSFNSIVKLNVGGVRYATSIATLTAAENSFFDVLFSGRWSQTQLTEEGEVFLDRDGEVRNDINARSSRAALRFRAGCHYSGAVSQGQVTPAPFIPAMLFSPAHGSRGMQSLCCNASRPASWPQRVHVDL